MRNSCKFLACSTYFAFLETGYYAILGVIVLIGMPRRKNMELHLLFLLYQHNIKKNTFLHLISSYFQTSSNFRKCLVVVGSIYFTHNLGICIHCTIFEDMTQKSLWQNISINADIEQKLLF